MPSWKKHLIGNSIQWVWLPFVSIWFTAPCQAQVPSATQDLILEVVATTVNQIILGWTDPDLDVVGYDLERDVSPSFDLPTSYSIAPDSANFTFRIFSDTNRPVVSKYRFGGTPGDPLLDPDTEYFYRARAHLLGGATILSNTVSARVGTPVRGVEGDLWADVVLGKPAFSENSFGKTDASASEIGGGVFLDKRVHPNRMYVVDCNQNRILGWMHLGVCEADILEASNLAAGRPYTKNPQPSTSSPDTGNQEFTDGQPSRTQADSFGYQLQEGVALTVDINVDLGSIQAVNFASYSSGAGTADYDLGTEFDYVVGSLGVLVSSNGSTWVQVASYQNTDRNREIRLLFAETMARYVRFRGTSKPGVNGAGYWLYIGEGRVGRLNAQALSDHGVKLCTEDSDLVPGCRCRMTGREPDIAIGQPGFEDCGACNGDATYQTYPYRMPSSATSLCFTLPEQISMSETNNRANLAVDASGALYVPDIYNNRVLKYDDPFPQDPIADDVWGQPDFSSNERNHGNELSCSDDSLFLRAELFGAGICIDPQGNLWVADNGNNRVLRFPKVGGSISHHADLVLGQPDFVTGPLNAEDRLDRLIYPTDVAVDEEGNVYVSQMGGWWLGITGRILVFHPPLSSGMMGEIVSASPDVFFPISIELDNQTHSLWVQNANGKDTAVRLDLDTHAVTKSVFTFEGTGMDIDSSGNLYVLHNSKHVDRYRFPDFLPNYPGGYEGEFVFPDEYVTSRDTTWGIMGSTVLGNQLVVGDWSRLMIWNDVTNLSNGQPADDLFGDVDFQHRTDDADYVYPQADQRGRIWVMRYRPHLGWDLLAFDSPLAHSSVPSKTVPISGGGLQALGGGTLDVAGDGNMPDFAIDGSRDRIWVADRLYSRVFRLTNIDGEENPSSGPYVDVVLGQTSLTATGCNLGDAFENFESPTASSLCIPYNVAVDPMGNLVVSDTGLENGDTNERILIWEAASLPDSPASVVFAIPADHVLGTGGDFNIRGVHTSDPKCSPFRVATHLQGPFVAPMNPYSAQRFALVYLDPLHDGLPQFALGDFLDYCIGGGFFDSEGNLYVGDSDWSRLLIYEKPLKMFLPTLTPTLTPTITETPTPTSTATITPTPSATPEPSAVEAWEDY